MKILMLSPHLAPTYTGGVELHTATMSAWMRSRRHEPVIAAVESVTDPLRTTVDVDSAGGVRVHRFSGPIARPDARRWLADSDRALGDWLGEVLRAEAPDVVHLQSGYLLGRAVLPHLSKRSVPLVVFLHDLWFNCARVTQQHPDGRCCSGPAPVKCTWCLMTERRRFRLPDQVSRGTAGAAIRAGLRSRWLRGALVDRSGLFDSMVERRTDVMSLFRRADALLSPSRFLRDELGRSGLDVGRVELVRLGTVLAGAAIVRQPPPDGRLRVGYLGQVAPHKGVHLLMEAVRGLGSHLTLAVHGDARAWPHYAESTRRQAAGLPHVTIHGHYDRSALVGILGGLDLVVVPSIWPENQPLVISEARVARVPIIASRIGGLVEMVGHEKDGVLVEAGNVEELARQLRKLADRRDLLDAFAAAAPRPPTIDDEGEALMAIYRRVMERGNRSDGAGA